MQARRSCGVGWRFRSGPSAPITARCARWSASAAEIMPVVKADAYRHGAVEVSRALEAEGAPWLAVSNVEEGIALRQAGIARAHPGDGGFPSRGSRRAAGVRADSGGPFARRHSARAAVPIISRSIAAWAGWGRARRPRRSSARWPSGPGDLEGLMTHFASAGNYASPQTEEQIERFEACWRRCARAASRRATCTLRHHSGGVPQDGSVGQSGAAGARHLRVRVAGARGFAPAALR